LQAILGEYLLESVSSTSPGGGILYLNHNAHRDRKSSGDYWKTYGGRNPVDHQKALKSLLSANTCREIPYSSVISLIALSVARSPCRGSASPWSLNLFRAPKLNAVINRLSQILFAANISFGCENGSVSEQKLDLFKLPSGSVAPSRTTAAKVVRS
jgi:hypothetical protein